MSYSYKRIYKNPFYVYLKKHYCPDCHELMDTITVSKSVNSRSSEAEEYDFHNVDTYMIGNVDFTWTEFECPKCGRQIGIDEMKRLEGKLPNKTTVPRNEKRKKEKQIVDRILAFAISLLLLALMYILKNS